MLDPAAAALASSPASQAKFALAVETILAARRATTTATATTALLPARPPAYAAPSLPPT